MRRTTICRSSRVAVIALAATLSWRVLPAQDTTLVARDTTLVQDTGVAAFQGQIPATHTVARGETLWSIAQMYFNDPLLWPEIYRLNTSIVEDPHWIYPGEELNLAQMSVIAQGGDTVAVAPDTSVLAADTVSVSGDTVVAIVPLDTAVAPIDTFPAGDTTFVIEAPPPPVNESNETIFDRRRTGRQVVADVLRGYVNQPYRPLRPGEFYAAGFLTETEPLPWGNVLGSTSTSAIHRLSQSSSATMFQEISVRPPGKASYHVGDSLLLARIDRGIDFGQWGEVVVPTGVARVTSIEEQQVLAEVVSQFGRIRDGELAMPLEPFRDPGNVRPVPVEQGLAGKLIGPRDARVIAGAQQYFFIDKGRSDGVTPGDVFEAYKPAEGAIGSASEEVRAVLMIVHTRERSATGLLIQIIHPGLYKDMPVRLIRKMPS
jgi:hypothetical protein